MSRFKKLSHVIWHCQYHIVWVPKYRYRVLSGEIGKVSISKLMGTLKGRTAIIVFSKFPYLKNKPYWGNHFWAPGYCVDTVGLDAEMIRKYVK